MRRTLLATLVLALMAVPAARAADIGFDINIHLPDGVSRPAPAPIIVRQAPLFLVPSVLGFAVAVGVPYDMFYLGGRYYLCRSGVWYIGPGYNGPWQVVHHDRLPRRLRRYRVARIRHFREEEYRHYRREGNRYRGRAFRPGHRENDHGRGERDSERGNRDHGRHRGWN